MSLTTWMARKGAVGGTTRWTALFHNDAINNQTYNVDNFSTQEGINMEVNKLVETALHARQKVSSNEDVELIRNIYQGAPLKGLVALTIAILKVEASFSDNDKNVVNEFVIIIDEEISKKGAGDVIKYGTNRDVTGDEILPLLWWANHQH